MRISILAISILLLASLPAAASEEKHPHWAYSGKAGPAHWGELEKGFGVCSTGHSQSPIDLSHMVDKQLPAIAFDYKPGGYRVVNNGHAVQLDFKPGSGITLDGTRFELKQLHFHTPGENTIGGKSFPMEAHLVHADAKGHLAVVALMFKNGSANTWLPTIGPRTPDNGGEIELSMPVAATALLPANRDYYRFSGSLTTPPCSEDVRWLVLKQAVTANAKQIEAIHAAIGHANNRPVQPVGERVVLE